MFLARSFNDGVDSSRTEAFVFSGFHSLDDISRFSNYVVSIAAPAHPGGVESKKMFDAVAKS